MKLKSDAFVVFVFALAALVCLIAVTALSKAADDWKTVNLNQRGFVIGDKAYPVISDWGPGNPEYYNPGDVFWVVTLDKRTDELKLITSQEMPRGAATAADWEKKTAVVISPETGAVEDVPLHDLVDEWGLRIMDVNGKRTLVRYISPKGQAGYTQHYELIHNAKSSLTLKRVK